MEYKKFKKESATRSMLGFDIEIQLLSLKDIRKGLNNLRATGRDSSSIEVLEKTMHGESQKLNDLRRLFQLSESEKTYNLLIKQLEGVRFMTKYYDSIEENLEIRKLRRRVAKWTNEMEEIK